MDLFILEQNEHYEKRCGEMFLTTKGRVVLHCALCDDKFGLFKAFFAHLLDIHLPEEIEYVNDGLFEVNYNDEYVSSSLPQFENELTQSEDLYSFADESKNNEKILEVCNFDNTSNDGVRSCEETDDKDQNNRIEQRTLTEKEAFEKIKKSNHNLYPPIKVRDVHSRLFPRSALTSEEERKHKCPFCGFGFKSRHNMIHHLKRHTDKKDHLCSKCPKAFYTSSELRIHKRCHEEEQERSFLCTECGASFYDNCDLKKHMRRHLGIKNETCNICSKKFFDSDQLRNHMKIHSSNRPFVCKECKANFKELKRLQIHMKLHEGKREFVCVHCGAAFNRKSLLSSHINLRHKNT